MKKYLFVLAINSLVGALPLAQAQTQNNPCLLINLTSDQISSIKNAQAQFKQTKAGLVAQISAARLSYSNLVSDPASDANSAQTAAQNIESSIDQLVSAQLAFRSQILFQILTPAQRGPAVQCNMLKKSSQNSQSTQPQG